jgi:glutathione S-transferase
VKRGYVALDHLEQQFARTRFLVGESFTLADVALLAYTRVAHEGGFDLARYAGIRRWIVDGEHVLRLAPVAQKTTGPS